MRGHPASALTDAIDWGATQSNEAFHQTPQVTRKIISQPKTEMKWQQMGKERKEKEEKEEEKIGNIKYMITKPPEGRKYNLLPAC